MTANFQESVDYINAKLDEKGRPPMTYEEAKSYLLCSGEDEADLDELFDIIYYQ